MSEEPPEEQQPSSEQPKTVEDYIKESRMFGDVPRDQFSHQFKLLYHPQSAPKTQMDLLPPDAILGLVKDSKTLFLLQNDCVLLNRFFDMGKRCNGIMELFDSLFYPWWQQLRMTGALGATERWLQSFLEPTSVPYEGFSFLEKREMEKIAKTRKGFVRDYLNKFRGNEGKIYE